MNSVLLSYKKAPVLLIALFVLFHINLQAQSFVNINAGILSLSAGAGEWGDYDNDKDLDLLVNGESSGGVPFTRIYMNEEGAFSDIDAGLPGVANGRASWNDFDNDGDLDVLITGENSDEKTFLFSNDNGVFTEESAISSYFGPFSSASWGDYDNDGDADLFLTGDWSSRLFTNEGNGTFSPTSFEFIDLSSGRAAWADIDNDRDMDLLVTGDTGGGMKLFLYSNEGDGFSETELEGMGLSAGSIELGDYDNDGDLDIVMMGFNDFVEPEANIYRNDGDLTFTNIWAGLAPVTLGKASWGDVDNDGDLDVALTGKLSGCGVFTSEIYENMGNDYFNSLNAALPGAELSYVSWGDFDNDSDLDLFLTGSSYSGGPFSRIYKNESPVPNSLPEPPENLTVEFLGNEVLLSWSEGSDDQTPAPGLSYNLRIGTSPLGCDLISPLSHLDDGFRKVSGMGNTTLENSASIKGLEEGATYYWSVQAVDHGHAASAFSEEQSFTVIYTDISEGNKQSSFTVIPNPAKNFITLEGLNNNIPVMVEIYSFTGEKIRGFCAGNGTRINIEGFVPGIYFIRSSDDPSPGTTKFLVR